MRGKALDWFTSYLSHRTQYVKIRNSISISLEVICGVPQSSALGPFLVMFNINDISNALEKLSFRLFAYDANIFYSSKDPQELETIMNIGLQDVLNYCKSNQLSVTTKTNYMVIRSPRKRINYDIK